MANIFQEVRDRVSLEDFARDNGFAPNRAGKCSCPLHTDKTPSLHIYSSEKRWKCFSCGKHGDVTDLASVMWGCSKFEAVKRLDEQYRLGLEFDGDSKEPMRKSRIITFDLKAWQKDADATIAWTINLLWETAEAGKRVRADRRLINALWEEISSLEELHDKMMMLSPAEEFKKYHDVVRRLKNAQGQHKGAIYEWLAEHPL